MNSAWRCSACGCHAWEAQPDESRCRWSFGGVPCIGRIVRVPWVRTEDDAQRFEVAEYLRSMSDSDAFLELFSNCNNSVQVCEDDPMTAIEAMAEVRRNLMIFGSFRTEIVQDPAVPLWRDERDGNGEKTGKREPVLCVRLDDTILVHPERWHLFHRVIDDIGRTGDEVVGDAGQADDERE